MKPGKFTYKVGILVEFTIDELRLLRDCCLGHYDHRVKAAADPGGFVYGWLQSRDTANDASRCSFDELDTCAKALEQEPIGGESIMPLAGGRRNGLAEDGRSLTKPYKARLELGKTIALALRKLSSEWSSIDASARQARLSESTANLDHCDKCDQGTRLIVTRRVCHTCNSGIERHKPS